MGVRVTALLLLSACTDGEVRKDETVPKRPTPALRLVVLTDLAGTLEPCGCTSRPLGGIDRVAAAVKDARDDGVPTLFVHAGDLFFGPAAHHGEGLTTQEEWKAQTVAQTLETIGLQAAAPGDRDIQHGSERFAELVRGHELGLLAAGLSATGATPEDPPPETDDADDADGSDDADEAEADEADAPGGETQRVELELPATAAFDVGGRRIGVVGAFFPDARGGWPPGFDGPADPVDAAAQAVRRVREDGADRVLALVHGARRQARALARELDVDFVVLGGIGEADPIPPDAAGGALLLHAGRQGQGVLVVDLWPQDRGAWTDVGALGREARRQRLETRIDELGSRLEAWEDDESTSEEDIRAQRRRLTRMRAELDALGSPEPLPKGNAAAARYVELPPEAPRDAEITRVLDRFFRKVNAHNREAYADRTPPPARPDGAGYVGSEACGSCHESELAWWEGTPHGRAYATLVERHKQFNLDCVACHVTGYGEPGGSTVTHVEDLRNVGCESCHGPGSVHVEDPEAPLRFVETEVPEPVCVECHNEEHSDLFDYRAYRNVLIMPGHGLPVETDR